MPTFLSINNLAVFTGTSFSTAHRWMQNGTYPHRKNDKGQDGFHMEDLTIIPQVNEMLESRWEEEMRVAPVRDFTSVVLFAGAGGLALGMLKAGLRHVRRNGMDATACRTLRRNHP